MVGILIIEDDPASLELAVYLLSARGYTLHSAADGAEGLRLAFERRPDLILCDLQMPVLDGFEVLDRLRSDPALRAIPVVAVSAFSMVGDRERALATGFTGYIAKPIDPETFAISVEAYLPRDRRVGASATRGPDERATILVVDDRPANRQFLLTLLGYSGHRLLEADDGETALRLVRTERPDLVITDILMPRMDGCQFVLRLREDPELADTKVIFFTATYRATEARALADSCGVQTVLGKPAEPQAILDAVHASLGITPDISLADVPASAGKSGGFDVGRVFDAGISAYASELQSIHDALDNPSQQSATVSSQQPNVQTLLGQFSGNLTGLRRLSGRLTTLIEVAIDARPELGSASVTELFFLAACEMLPCRYAAIGMLDKRGSARSLVFTKGMSDAIFGAATEGPEVRLPGSLLERLTPLRHRAQGAEDCIEGLPTEHPAVRNILGTCIVSRERAGGWIYFADRLGADEFSDEDERILTTLVTMLVMCHDSAVQYDMMQRHAAELQVQIDQRRQAEAEIQRRQQQQAQAQKIEAIGLMTTGIAHDFNNVLAAITGNLALIARYAATDPELTAITAEAVDAARQGAAMTRRLLSFSRQEGSESLVIDPVATIAQASRMWRKTLQSNVELRLPEAADVGHIAVDPIQFESALVNLTTNSQHAMPNGGVLTVETSHQTFSGSSPTVPPGDYVAVRIGDTGTGMSREVMQRIFEPFFTTKGVGMGTGLGLSIVSNFVKAAGGYITITSELGCGTETTLYFPRADLDLVATPAPGDHRHGFQR